MGPLSLIRLAVWLGALSGTIAAPVIEPRKVIGHDKVVGFPTSVPGGATGDLYKKYQPYLKVFHGCVPFPAVNRAGDTRCVKTPLSV